MALRVVALDTACRRMPETMRKQKIYLILEVWMTSWDMEERVCGGPGIGILNRHIMIGVSLVNPGSRFSMQQSKENHLW